MLQTDEQRAKDRARYKANPWTKRASSAARRKAFPERCRAVVQAWQKAHPEKILAANRSWKARHPEQRRATALVNQHKRLARLRNVLVNDFTKIEWEFIKAFFNFRCFYCDKEGLILQIEHMIPISRGGSHTAENIVPSCGICNMKKGTKTFEEFLDGKL